MKNANYKHLLEPIRVQIAIEFIQHEFRKIFPNIREHKIWNKLDKETKNLLKNKTFAPVKDFWNFFDAVCFGLKLKNLTIRLTSQNIKWSKEKVLVDDLYMGAKNDFKNLFKLSDNFPSGKKVREFLFNKNNKDILEKERKETVLHSGKTFQRDDYLIIAYYDFDGKLMIVDGNRRYLKKIIGGEKEIFIYCGRPIKFPELLNYWVPTSRILNLLSHARLSLKYMDKKAALCFSKSIGVMIKYSEFGQREFYNLIKNKKYLEEDKIILKEVEKILKSDLKLS